MSVYVPVDKKITYFAKNLTLGAKTPKERYDILTRWISGNIAYDYIKAMRVAKLKGIKPEPTNCFITHRGICQDIASLVTMMLRAVGIRAYLCIGHADNTYHAWVQAYISGEKVLLYDHEGTAKKYTIERKY